MTAVHIRSLAPTEQYYAMRGVYGGYSVCVRGELNIVALSAAFAALLRRHPVLAASLESVGDKYVIVAQPGPLPGVVVTEGDIDVDITGICADQRRALGGLHVTHDGDRASVTLFTHHSVADGQHSLALLVDLWSLYTSIARGEPVDTAPRAYPVSLETLLAERGFERQNTAASSRPHPVDDAAVAEIPEFPHNIGPYSRYTIASARCQFSEDSTSALLALAWRHATSLNSVISAAILQVEVELRDVAPERIQYSYPIDLRACLSPPVAADEATNPLGFASFTLLAPVADLVGAARAITLRLRDDLESTAVHQAGLNVYAATMAAAQIERVPEAERPIAIISTNLGVIPPLRAPEGLEFLDIRSMAANPEMSFNIPLRYVIALFQDRLIIELRNESDAALAQKRIAAIETVLLTVIDTDAHRSQIR